VSRDDGGAGRAAPSARRRRGVRAFVPPLAFGAPAAHPDPRALAHGAVPGEPWLGAWHPAPAPVAALLLAAAVYLWAAAVARRRGHAPPAAWRVASFLAGLGVLAVALVGPLDAANDVSFTMHMAQHLALMQLGAPLIVLGRPGATILRAIPAARVGGALRALVRLPGGRATLAALVSPWLVGIAFNANLALWHLPWAYDAALRSAGIHDAEHLGFLGAAIALWWMLLGPFGRHGPASPHAAFGLSFASCMAGGTVALALIFAPYPIYPWYRTTASPLGLSALADQRLGGLIMAAGGAVYFVVLFGLLWRDANRR